MQVRKFRIVGLRTGETFDLNNKQHFIYAPQNLGIKFKNEFVKVLNTLIKVESQPEMQDFISKLLLKDYKVYEQFRSFLSRNRADGFRFYYSPYLGLERYIICDIKEMSKTELEFDGTVRSDIKITPRSYWLLDTTQVIGFIDTTQDGKEYVDTSEAGLFKYAYTYAEDSEESGLFKYNYIYMTGGKNTAVLTNEGDYETSLKITLNGAFTNPYIQITDVNGQLIQDSRFEIAVDADEKFIIDSSPESLKIVLLNSIGEEIDKTDTQDYSRTTYLTLPLGEFTLTIQTDTSEPVTGSIEYKVNYTGA